MSSSSPNRKISDWEEAFWDSNDFEIETEGDGNKITVDLNLSGIINDTPEDANIERMQTEIIVFLQL